MAKVTPKSMSHRELAKEFNRRPEDLRRYIAKQVTKPTPIAINPVRGFNLVLQQQRNSKHIQSYTYESAIEFLQIHKDWIAK